MLKELTIKEALQLLAEKYPKEIYGYFWNGNINNKNKEQLFSVCIEKGKEYFLGSYDFYEHFAIEVPDEYRYMTEEEHDVWLVTVGYKNHQMRCKGSKWYNPFYLDDFPINDYEYRTVEIIDGKIVYGQPQEFKVKVDG